MDNMRIAPYKFKGAWVFDDPSRGLDKEALVSGTDKIIEHVCAVYGISSPESGIIITFSGTNCDGDMRTLVKTKGGDCNGTWYRLENTDMEGWLCPALFRFFKVAPEKIYFKIEEDCLVNRIHNRLKCLFSTKKNPVVMPS